LLFSLRRALLIIFKGKGGSSVKRLIALIAGILILLALIYFVAFADRTPQVAAPQGEQIEGLNGVDIGEK
jgi:hypothetical protein